MNYPESFTIKVHNMYYIIKPLVKEDHVLYEVFTSCEKLFTLKKSVGKWETNEEDVIPISNNLVDDIGEVLEEYERQQQTSLF